MIVCSERSLSQRILIPLYIFTPSPSWVSCKSLILTGIFFFFFCSDECQMPELFWMVKLLSPINSLKLIGVLLSWDGFRPLCHLHDRFSASRLYAVMLWFNIFICRIQELFLRHYTHFNELRVNNLDFSLTSWFESRT